MNKRWKVWCVLMTTGMVLSGCAQQEKTPEPQTFPIGMWVSPPEQFVTLERYQEIADSGINFIIGFNEWQGGPELQLKSLDLADQVGLKVIVRDPEILATDTSDNESFKTLLEAYSYHPAYMGHVFYDEPSMVQYDTLSQIAVKYNEVVSDGIGYVNLFPTYSTAEQRGGTYKDYVASYVDMFKPKVISFDHYPFLNEVPGKGPQITEDYYYNLALISEEARLHKLPLWTFIQTLAFNDSHRDPTEIEMKWQIYTNLAYGAKGIQYFTYWTPENGREWFGEAMIDREGNRTKHYDEVTRINQAIQPIALALINKQSSGVIYHNFVPPLIDNPQYAIDDITSIIGDNAIIGVFEDGKQNRSLLIIGESYVNSSSLNITFDEAVKKLTIIREENEETIKLGKARSFELRAEQGEAVLIELHK